MAKVIISRSPKETRALGEKIAWSLKAGDILALTGNLGSGKTTFLKGLLRRLKAKTRVTSPTFVILNVYPLPNGRKFYHFDLYRLKSALELVELGFTEAIREKASFMAVEWPEKIKNLLPRKTRRIAFRHGKNPTERIIVFK